MNRTQNGLSLSEEDQIDHLLFLLLVWLFLFFKQRCLKKPCVGCMILKIPLTVVNKDGCPVYGSGPCNANSLTIINHSLIYLIKLGPASQRHLSFGCEGGLWCHNYFLYCFIALCVCVCVCRQRKRAFSFSEVQTTQRA